MKQQLQFIIMELYKVIVKNDSKEMLSIDILSLLSNCFATAVFSIIIKYNW